MLVTMNIPVLLDFARQDLLDRYSGSVFGVIWILMQPLMKIAIFALVFSKIMGAKLEGFGQTVDSYSYTIYLVTGILAWTSFANTLQRITTVYTDKAAILSKVKLELKTFPLYILISEAVAYCLSMLIFLVFLVLIGFPIDRFWMLVPVIYLIQQVLAYGIGLGLAVLNVFTTDIREFVAILIQLWFWLTPIVYLASIVPDEMQRVMGLNPFYTIMQGYHSLILFHRLPDVMSLMSILGVGLAIVFLSTRLNTRLEKDLRDSL